MQDQRGETVDDEEGEEIDWGQDYMADDLATGKTNGVAGSDSDEGGPTFGHVDLNAPEGDSDDENDFEAGDLDDDDGMHSNNGKS
jgi:U3 small nucleolar RNA-associated protein MPP10